MDFAPTAEFLAAAEAYGIAFEEGELEQLGKYLELLLTRNQTMNLTAIREPAAAWMRHIFDSLTLMATLADLPEKAKVIDVGSGGGLPGIPLAISMKHLQFVLLEATGKKAVFLNEAVQALGLTNVTVVNERAEVAAHDRGKRVGNGRIGGHREVYEAVVARAVGPMAVLAELTVPFARTARGVEEGIEGEQTGSGIGGRIVLIKGEKADEELVEAKEALHILKAVHETTVTTPTGRIVILSKGAATPKVYPRANGEPKRVPLGVGKEGKEAAENSGKAATTGRPGAGQVLGGKAGGTGAAGSGPGGGGKMPMGRGRGPRDDRRERQGGGGPRAGEQMKRGSRSEPGRGAASRRRSGPG